MLALLALMEGCGRAEAIAILEALSHHGDAALRWAALRQWTAMDTAGAAPRLAAMAAGDDDARLRQLAMQTVAVLTRHRALA